MSKNVQLLGVLRNTNMTNLWGTGYSGPEEYIVDAFVQKMRDFQSELIVAGSEYPQLAPDFQALHMQVENLIGEIQRSREVSVGDFDEYIHGKKTHVQDWTGF